MNKVLYGLTLSLLFTMTTVMAEVSPETIVNVFERIESLEKKMRELHGKNEELQHAMSQLKKQQKQSFLAIDERVEELSNAKTDAKTPAKKPSSDVKKEEEEEEPRVKIIDNKAEESEENIKNKPTKEATKEDKSNNEPKIPVKDKVTQSSKPKAGRAPSTYEKEVYQTAFNLMKTSPSGASRAFKEYIKMQPNSPLAANAQYWVGEIMYSHNNYKGAVQEFIKVLQKYKYSDKAPDAALKLGYSFYALKNWTYARRTFEDVLKYFPNNKNAVNLAKRRLEKMKTSGH